VFHDEFSGSTLNRRLWCTRYMYDGGSESPAEQAKIDKSCLGKDPNTGTTLGTLDSLGIAKDANGNPVPGQEQEIYRDVDPGGGPEHTVQDGYLALQAQAGHVDPTQPYLNYTSSMIRSKAEFQPTDGRRGDRVEHLRVRWQRDALDHKPSVLSVFVGVNDTLVAFFEGPPTPPDIFSQRYSALLARSSAVPRVMVVEPFYVTVRSPDVPWGDDVDFVRADLDRTRPIVRALAAEFGTVFVPLQEPIDAAVRAHGAAAIAPDGVHPSPLGHEVIAHEWLKAYAEATTSGK